MTKKILIVFVFHFNILFSQIPMILSIDGNASQDSLIHISGNTFGNKNSPAPIKWDNFESGTAGNDLTGWSLSNSGGINPKYSTSVVKNGMQSAICNFIVNYNCGFIENETLDQFYMSFYYRADYGNQDYNGQYCRNFKVFRAEGDNGTKLGDQHEGVPLFAYEIREPRNGKPEVAVRPQYEPTLLSDTFYMDGAWDDQLWIKIELWASVRTGERTFELYRSYVDESPSEATLDDCWIPDMGDDESKFNQIRLGYFFAQEVSPSGDVSANVYFDDVYIDSTRARVEIGNNSVFANCTHREIQAPTAWATDEITITFNQGSFEKDDNVWLFVVDSDGDVSSGYAVTIGGEGSGEAPATGDGSKCDVENIEKE